MQAYGPVYKEQLLYSDKTMSQLAVIVDSLHLKFRQCEPSKTYFSLPQAIGHYVCLSGQRAKEAKRDMDLGMPFEALVRKYLPKETDKHLLIVKSRNQTAEGTPYLSFKNHLENIGLYSTQYVDIPWSATSYNLPLKNQWVYNYREQDGMEPGRIKALYFITEFESKALPAKYARMVQYAECMVDTTEQVFREEARRSGEMFWGKHPAKIRALMDYIHTSTGKPTDYSWDDAVSLKKNEQWKQSRFHLIDSLLAHQDKFKKLLAAAVDQALKEQWSGEELEEYTARYYSKEAALELKRRRIVTGFCSFDKAPKVHAMHIATLAAETANWGVFLRAHLDILNDYFARISDNGLAWSRRETHIAELESLDMDVTGLLLGTSLTTFNAARNRYMGDVSKIGRAFIETKFPDQVEVEVLTMIRDPQLDLHNRLLMCFLFLNYIDGHPREEIKRINFALLHFACLSFPDYIRTKLPPGPLMPWQQ